MVSAPEDLDIAEWFSYEDEELAILQAFSPLMESGQVEIDFCEDGSLETLGKRLIDCKYHILHFSGHGIFKKFKKGKNKGYLLLENAITMKKHLVEDRNFADTVNCHPDYLVPMVVLSSCQAAMGGSEETLRGVTNHLLRIGVPVVACPQCQHLSPSTNTSCPKCGFPIGGMPNALLLIKEAKKARANRDVKKAVGLLRKALLFWPGHPEVLTILQEIETKEKEVSQLTQELNDLMNEYYTARLGKFNLPTIFISYSHRDKKVVNRLTIDLEKAGAKVWVDEKEIKVGESISQKIEEGISGCNFFCLVISSHSVM